MKRRSLGRALSVAAAVIALAAPANAQRVVASHDEWFTSSCCFGANEHLFLSNALNWFGVTSGGNVLVYSDNDFITDGAFTNFLTGLSINSTTDFMAPSASFSSYDAIFVSGNSGVDAAALISYVLGGGNVFVLGGTGIPDAVTEAAYNNAFLNAFGLGFASTYNGIGTVNTSTYASQGPYGNPLFAGVNSVYADNGNSVQLTAPVAGVTSQVFLDGREGVFGAAEVTAAPEPAALGLMATGLIALVPLARRKRSK